MCPGPTTRFSYHIFPELEPHNQLDQRTSIRIPFHSLLCMNSTTINWALVPFVSSYLEEPYEQVQKKVPELQQSLEVLLLTSHGTIPKLTVGHEMKESEDMMSTAIYLGLNTAHCDLILLEICYVLRARSMIELLIQNNGFGFTWNTSVPKQYPTLWRYVSNPSNRFTDLRFLP